MDFSEGHLFDDNVPLYSIRFSSQNIQISNWNHYLLNLKKDRGFLQRAIVFQQSENEEIIIKSQVLYSEVTMAANLN